MNRRPQGLTLSKTLTGFIQHKVAEGLSPNTLVNYERHLVVLTDYLGNASIGQVTSQDLRSFFAWLRTDYEPKRLTGGDQPLSPKTRRNIWATLRSFFSWASEEFDLANPMNSVKAPRFERPPVEPFTKNEVEALLKACKFTREANTTNRKSFSVWRPTARRDEAIILTLLDTGLRASELCSLRLGDIEIRTGKVHIQHGVTGGAKSGKGRFVYLGRATRRSLWRYLADREDHEDLEAPLFVGLFDRPMNRGSLRQLLKRLADKAGVRNCHPHRFRHTFAISYLRAGGDLFTLQSLLGHTSLDMVKHYTKIAQIDVAHAHRRASPADNWRL